MFRNFMRTNRSEPAQLATDFAPKPGDYELGSLESRAAARAMLGDSNKLLMVLRYHFIGSNAGEDILMYTHHKETWKTRDGVRYEKKKPSDPVSPNLIGPDIFIPVPL